MVAKVISASISCDEGSPVWTARIVLAELDKHSLISVGDEFTLLAAGETFHLVVDGKQISRGEDSLVYEVSALSPLARYDSQFSADIQSINTGAISASSLVFSLIGTVTWSMADWNIPAGEAAFTDVSPLKAAQRVVESAGGVIESAPDGTVTCRMKHPVNVPDYSSAVVDHSLFDSEVFASSASLGGSYGFNRVVVGNDSTSFQSTDVVEDVPNPLYPKDDTKKRIRAYLSFQRPVGLVHTGNPSTVITPLGEQTRIEPPTDRVEIIEFKNGIANTAYSIESIVSMSWQATNLGGVVFSGTKVVAAVAGYSLLNISYTVKSLDWNVELNADQEVQFVVIDI